MSCLLEIRYPSTYSPRIWVEKEKREKKKNHDACILPRSSLYIKENSVNDIYVNRRHSQCMDLRVREINDNSEPHSSPISSANAHEPVGAHN